MRRGWLIERLPHAPLGVWLLLIGLMATLPVLIFSLLTVGRLVEAAHVAEIETLQRRAAVAADTIDRALERFRALSKVLTLSEPAVTGDFRALHAQAGRVRATEPGVQVFSLARADGRRLMSTSRPWGQVAPTQPLTAWELQAIERDEVLVSHLMPAGSTGGVIVAVLQPLTAPDGERLILRTAVRQAVLHEALVSLRWPASWTVTLIDQHMNIVARSRDEPRFLGQPVTPDLQRQLKRGDRAPFIALNKEGVRTLAVTAPVPGTGWSIVVGLPAAEVEARERSHWRWMFALGTPLCLLSLGLSVWLGRELRRQVRDVAKGELAAPVRIPELRMITARARRATDALDAARLDGLTALAARPLFQERLQALAKAAVDTPDAALALLFIDLDGFKAVNDGQGHEAGDGVLRAVADVLRRVLRSGDLSARFGGDEFVAALSGPSATLPGVAREVATRLVHEVAALGSGIGCSIGVAVAPAGADLTALMARADQAMLRAKAAGKNRVVLHEDPEAP